MFFKPLKYSIAQSIRKIFFNSHKKIFIACRQTKRIVKLIWHSNSLVASVLPITTIIAAPLPILHLYCWKRVIDGILLCLQKDISIGQELIFKFICLNFAIMIAMRGLDSINHFLEYILNLHLSRHIQKSI